MQRSTLPQQPLPSFKSYFQQIEMLKSRGILIANERTALAVLEYLSDFRLNEFCRALGNTNGSTPRAFDDLVKYYMLNQALISLLSKVLSEIEVSLRARLAYHFGRHDTTHLHDALYKPEYFYSRDYHSDFIALLENKRKSGRRMPIWEAVEYTTFAELANLFSNLRPFIADDISEIYGLETDTAKSYFKALSYLRNCCAHHELILLPRKMRDVAFDETIEHDFDVLHKTKDNQSRRSLYASLCVMFLIYPDQAAFDAIVNLLDDYGVHIHDPIGLPIEWKDKLLNIVQTRAENCGHLRSPLRTS